MGILEETRKMVYAARAVGKDVDELSLSTSRLNEFLLAAVSNRRMTTDEIEQMCESVSTRRGEGVGSSGQIHR